MVKNFIESKSCTLYSLANWQNGLAFKNITFSNSGLPIIKIAELKNGITDQTKFTQDKFDKNVFLTKGDMLFSWSGNPETSIDTFIYNLSDGWLNQHIFKITPKNIDSKYFYYVMKSLNPVFKRIASNKQTTGLGHVTVKDLKEIKIFIPSHEEQHHIVNILGTIDDKIENNEKILKLLDKKLSMIYEKNFCKKLKINNNYKLIRLSDIANFQSGYSYKGKDLVETSKVALMTIKNFDRNVGFKIDGFKDLNPQNDSKQSQIVELYDTVVAHTDLTQNAEIIGNAEMLLNKSKYEKIIASMDLVIVKPKNINKFLLYLYLHNKDFKNHALGYTAGTTVLHLNKKALQEYKISFPVDNRKLIKLENEIESLILKQSSIIEINIKLNELKQFYLKKFFG